MCIRDSSKAYTSAYERVCYHPGFAAFMKLIDVTVPLDAHLPIYPGNTPFTVEAVKRIARGDSSNVSTLHMSAHTGTHVDAPRHYFDDARDPGSGPASWRNSISRTISA